MTRGRRAAGRTQGEGKGMGRTVPERPAGRALSPADRADALLGTVSAALAYVSAALVGVAMIAVLADVGGRTLFSKPLAGVPELGRYLVVTIALLGIPYAMRKDAHIRSSLLSTVGSPRLARVVAIVGDLLGLAVFSLVAFYAWSPMMHALRTGQYDGQSVRFPTFPGRLVVFVAGLVMAAECVAAIRRHLRRDRAAHPELAAAASGAPPEVVASE
jgi:TRAP-type C4-dicarboxylate transport system permease small subunit